MINVSSAIRILYLQGTLDMLVSELNSFVQEYPKVLALKTINGNITVSYKPYLHTKTPYRDFIKCKLYTGLKYSFVVILVDRMLRFLCFSDFLFFLCIYGQNVFSE